MNKNRRYTFQEDLAKRLKNPEFRKEWEATEPEHNLARQIIEARIKQNLSQRELAARILTSQAIVSRIESGSANTSIALMKRFAKALNTDLTIHIPKSI
jgi:ribosome-binding protein aMBF1 (putative translation factor)